MKKGFSILNIIIILTVIVFSYLLYSKYFSNKNEKVFDVSKENTNIEEINDSSVNSEQLKPKKEELKHDMKAAKEKEGANPLPNVSTLPTEKKKIDNTTKEETKIVGPSTDNGYYENSVYNYSIIVPNDWPLKIRSENNISLGITPPKNGQGAIKIEVGENTGKEIEEAKAEAEKYSGMVKLTEETISLSGVQGIKLTLENFMAGMEDYYIVLKKNDLDYIIKYSNESPSFLAEAEKALDTFNFK